jgi:hypothetical protein
MGKSSSLTGLTLLLTHCFQVQMAPPRRLPSRRKSPWPCNSGAWPLTANLGGTTMGRTTLMRAPIHWSWMSYKRRPLRNLWMPARQRSTSWGIFWALLIVIRAPRPLLSPISHTFTTAIEATAPPSERWRPTPTPHRTAACRGLITIWNFYTAPPPGFRGDSRRRGCGTRSHVAI